MPSELHFRSSPLLVQCKSTPCGPAPSWSYHQHWGERLLREASLWTSWSLACRDGLTWYRIQQSACRLCQPDWPTIWPLNRLPCSSCLRLLWEWGSTVAVATPVLIACVWEPLSWLPPHHGARLFNRLEPMKQLPHQWVLLTQEPSQEAYLDMGHLLQDLPRWTSPFGACLPRRSLCPQGCWPPVGRASAQMMRTAMEKQAQVQMAMAPWLPPPWLLPPQAPPPQAPQMVPFLCQPLPSSVRQPVTPYKQAVVAPRKLNE